MTLLDTLYRLRLQIPLFFGLLLFYGSVGVWLGSMIFFGVGVAAPIFKILPSKDLAGTLNAVILQRLNLIEYISFCLLVIGLALCNRPVRGMIRTLPFVIAGIMLCITLWYAQGISPRMNTLKRTIVSFDTPQEQDAQAISEFRSLHIVYSRLVGINAGLLLLLIVWQSAFLVSTPLYITTNSIGVSVQDDP
jgi:hypothetical protein